MFIGMAMRAQASRNELIDFEHGRMLCHGNRCSALVGKIGSRAQCSVYENRPLVCREFRPGRKTASWFGAVLICLRRNIGSSASCPEACGIDLHTPHPSLARARDLRMQDSKAPHPGVFVKP